MSTDMEARRRETETEAGHPPRPFIGMVVPHRPKMQPYSHRRATAIAIDLERSIDRMAAIAGRSVPLSTRIAAFDSTTARLSRLDLPRPRTLAALCELHDERLILLRELHDEVAPTLGRSARRMVDTIMAEAETRVPAESAIPWHDAKRVTRPDPATPGFDDHRTAICRAADRPDPPVIPRPPSIPAAPQPGAIAIDLVLDGMLTHHGIDRPALHAEITALSSARRSTARFDVCSPATRSNSLPALASLGRDFPPAILRLAGPSLDTVAMEIPVRNGATGDVWLYKGAHVGRPVLRREAGMREDDLFSFPRMTLSEALKDDCFHPAIVVRATERLETLGGMRTVIELYGRHAHLDPGPPDERHRLPIAAIDPTTIPEENRIRIGLDAVIDADHVEALIRRLAPRERIAVKAMADGRIKVGSITLTTHELDHGESYVERRLGAMLTRIEEWNERRRQQEEREAKLLADQRRREAEWAEEMKAAERRQEKRSRDEIVGAIGEENARGILTAPIVDLLLRDMVAENGPWRDPAIYARSEARIIRHPRHKVQIIAFARLGAHATYEYDGIAHHPDGMYVHGTIRIDAAWRNAGPPEQYEKKPVGELIMWRGSSGGGRVMRMEITTEGIVASVKYPLVRNALPRDAGDAID